MRRMPLYSIIFLACTIALGAAADQQIVIKSQIGDASSVGPSPDEQSPAGIINYGFGPGVTPTAQQMQTGANATKTQQVPTATPAAATGGFFAAPVSWPIIPIHVALLPDGRLMSFGTDQTGQQGATMYYDVWTPSLGTGMNAHNVLPNTTGTDIFCGSQSLSPLTGQVFVNGGDLTIGSQRNYSNNLLTIFDPASNTIASGQAMAYPRWYSTLLALPNGDMAAFGGRSNNSTMELPPPSIPVLTPEEYNVSTGWRTLTGIASRTAFNQWYYPQVAVAPGGTVFLANSLGTLFSMDLTANGTITQLQPTIPASVDQLPSISYAPGKMLSIRNNQVVSLIDYTNPVPVVSTTDNIDAVRLYANATIMADGKVLVTGGSAVKNMDQGVDYQSEIWDPATGHWTGGASATIPRLYHSNSLLMPDGSVLTGGGGAPGPQTNLNAEIYYPPYLYTTTGAPANRPYLGNVPSVAYLGSQLTGTLGAKAIIGRVTLLRFGSSTHSYNSDQRFLDLPFVQNGQQITAKIPSDPTIALPGYYMMFVFTKGGVPSVASLVRVLASGQQISVKQKAGVAP